MAFSLASHHLASCALITPDTVTNAVAECKRRRCDGRSAEDRAANRGLVDHLVSAYQKRLADVEPNSLGGFEVDHQLELCGCLNGQLTWFLALEDAIGIR
jgi:hypothetical protein